MKYFNELLLINQKFIKEDNNIRIDNFELEEVYKKLDDFYKKEFNLEDFIKLCVILFNMQIFYDGNARTFFSYLTKIIGEHGYFIDIDKATEGLIKLKGFFPVMYDLNEELDDNEIVRITQFISKKESKGIKK